MLLWLTEWSVCVYACCLCFVSSLEEFQTVPVCLRVYQAVLAARCFVFVFYILCLLFPRYAFLFLFCVLCQTGEVRICVLPGRASSRVGATAQALVDSQHNTTAVCCTGCDRKLESCSSWPGQVLGGRHSDCHSDTFSQKT